jgi:transposase-like protein
MKKHRKSWNQQEKLTILQFYKEKGIGAASTEFNVSSTTIYNWENQLNSGGESSLSSTKKDSNAALIKKLEREIKELRNIVADNALEIRIKDEIIKKKILKTS